MSIDLRITSNAALKTTLEGVAKNNSVIRAMISDNVLTTEEVRVISTLDGVDTAVKIQVMTAFLGGSTNPTPGTGGNSPSTNAKIPYSEVIDKAKTIALQLEIKTAQAAYNAAIDKEAGLRGKLDKVNSDFEASRDELTKAVEKMTGAAENAAAMVNSDIDKILADAKNGKIDKATAKSRLASIGVPSISGQLSLGSLQTQVENLAGKIESLSTVYRDVAKVVGDLSTKYGNFLEVDIASICVNTAGKVIINQPGRGGPTKTGADGIASFDVTKFASMTTEDLAKALEGEYKGIFDSIKGSGATALTSTEAANVIKSLITKQSQGNASNFGKKGVGADVNILNGITRSDLDAAARKAQNAKTPPKSKDPYEITIDGKTYQFLKDNGDGKWDTADIFGINDSKDKIFESMKTADINKDGKITGEELAKMGIRMVLKEDGKLQTNNPEKDFDLNKIDSIDLKSLKNSNQNDGNIGTFGVFNMKLKDGRSIEGKQTFEEVSALQKLFQGMGSFFSKMADSVVNKFKLDPQTVEFYAKLGKFSSDMSKIDMKSTEESTNAAKITIDSSKANIDSAKNQDVGKDPNEAPKKEKEKPAAPKEDTENVKKKKPEEE